MKRALMSLGMLLGAVASLLCTGPARAGLQITLLERGNDLQVEVFGRLETLPTPAAAGFCGIEGALFGQFETKPNTNFPIICTGPDDPLLLYSITGDLEGFGGTAALAPADAVAGLPFWFSTSAYNGPPRYRSVLGLPLTTRAGDPLFSSATFAGRSLRGEGFTAPGPAGTWTLVGTEETIEVQIGRTATPAPLPLLGAGAALAWGRRLRHRLTEADGAPGPQRQSR
ncbi:MAG: hypothetical protein VKK62_08530 [Synechococcaceae cyanobacterium]|nr:hypothetical protein [Synechococcaceae cyanobacterium]